MNPTTTPIAVPPLNLIANFASLRDELLAELKEIAESGYYVLGPKVAAFEAALAEYHGCKFALGVSSGTDALLVAMMALDIKPGDEVICPTFTFFGTAGTIARMGARPVFCDINLDDYNLAVDELDALITPETRAIVPVHLYGQLADMDPLMMLARKHDLFVIEDACQAIGARDDADRMAGTFGEFGGISFYPTKNLGAMGDAGALVTNDEALFNKARQLRLHGETSRYHHQLIGGNFRIDALQAAILTIKLQKLEAWTERRRQIAAKYTTLLTEAGLAPEHVRPPAEVRGRHVYHQYVIRTPKRDALAEHLKSRQIGWGVYYPVPLHQQECFAYLGYKAGDLPNAELAAREVLALPMYPELSEAQIEAVVEGIASFFRK